MSAQLNKIIDPRDPLSKARRMELFRFAQDNGISDIQETMPADMMRDILRSRNVTSISVPDRPLGSAQQTFTTPTSHKTTGGVIQPAQEVIPVVSASVDVARQWLAQQSQPQPPQPTKPNSELSIIELRQACKARGIKIARTDKMTTLRAKLDGC